jgi:hypothetical protein
MLKLPQTLRLQKVLLPVCQMAGFRSSTILINSAPAHRPKQMHAGLLWNRNLLLCRFYYVHAESGHSQWVMPSATSAFDHSPAAGAPAGLSGLGQRSVSTNPRSHSACTPRCRCKQRSASSHPERVGRAGLRGSDSCSFGFDGLQVGATVSGLLPASVILPNVPA